MRRLIFGCGYLGRRVAQRWLAAGDEVFAVTRSAQRAEEFRNQGLTPIVADVLASRSLENLPPADTVLYAVGFDRTAGATMEQVYVGGLRTVLDALSRVKPERLVYISTTGVYGQDDGSVVNEDSPTQPTRESGQVCLAAERLLQAHRLGQRAIILRMAGLYGPNRLPRRDDLFAGKPILAEPESFLNLLHVDDAALIACTAADQAAPPRLYCVSDGCPVLRRNYFVKLASLYGAPPPKFVTPPPEELRQRRGGGDKKIDNARLMRELPVTLAFPSYREGLAAICIPKG